VAVKSLLLPPSGASEALLALFWRESSLQFHLRHEGVLQLLGVCLDRDEEGGAITEVALVMPRCALSLEAALAEASGCPPPAERLELLRQLARTLSFLHAQGIVHGDLKPANILLEAPGARCAKLCDFGHSRLRRGGGEEASLSLSSAAAAGGGGGTPRYRDPAVASGANALRKASDVYSFGILGWQLLCAAVPFEGMDVAAVLAHTGAGGRPALDRLPASMARVGLLLQRCWAAQQADRPSAAQLAAALEEV
jgi:serine/threonine-protein kinase